MFHNSSKNIIALVSIIVLVLAGCGDDSSNSASLDGDLSFEIKGETSIAFFVRKTEFNGNNINSEEVNNLVIPPAEGDLQDGDFDGYILEATPFARGEGDVTLMLLSDGDVLKETSTATDGTYRIEVGDVPDG